jgi:hypothetical protein
MSGCPDFKTRQRPVGYDARSLMTWGPGFVDACGALKLSG